VVSAKYVTASSDDSRVFFTSFQPLTAGSTAVAAGGEKVKEDLYVFELTSHGNEPMHGRLADLSADTNGGEPAMVLGVIGASEDGSYVYFIANGVLGDAGARGARKGDCSRTPFSGAAEIEVQFAEHCNLYMEHYDAATGSWQPPVYIATLSAADQSDWSSRGGNTGEIRKLTGRVSPNGRYLAFMSASSLTGYDNRDANSDQPDEEVYLYNAGAARLVCASCDPTGARPAGLLVPPEPGNRETLIGRDEGLWPERWIAATIPSWDTVKTVTAAGNTEYQSRYLSDSGRLFFNGVDALVPGDVNGNVDVYEYEPAGAGSCREPGFGQGASVVHDVGAEGCVGLISAGSSSDESLFMDASETGGDVFFMTRSHLSSQDSDSAFDVYDAHECTESAPCAPASAAVPPPCDTGDACKPAATLQPTIYGAPASSTFAGAGNVVAQSPSGKRARSRSGGRVRKLATALRVCRHKTRGHRRRVCEARARRRYGAVSASWRQAANGRRETNAGGAR
jgi:hypothetical protein